tara:strand:+ start:2115 stop:3194 length:1080 start_codon:yes stop_codon:yes gene_type:complete
MIKTNIRLGSVKRNCEIIVGKKILNAYLKKLNKKKQKKFIIIDNKVFNNFKISIKDKKTTVIKINGSENIKSINMYWKLTSTLLKKNIDRSSIVIAIGGGTIGDLTGFVASTVLRGVNFVLIPTTLLAQVDSSIGGKNGINSEHGKNLVGTFFQPNQVLVDIDFLKTLSKKQLKSGYAEILKHAIINDKIFYNWLKKNYIKLFNLNEDVLIKAIVKSIKIKLKYVLSDEKENLTNINSRAILNFGHTFGHAIESINKYKASISHGEAVAIGMVIATKLSYKLNKIGKKEMLDIVKHIKNAKLPIYSNLIKKNNFYKKIINDKKNRNNQVNLILLKNIGSAYFSKNHKLSEIKKMILNIN